MGICNIYSEKLASPNSKSGRALNIRTNCERHIDTAIIKIKNNGAKKLELKANSNSKKFDISVSLFSKITNIAVLIPTIKNETVLFVIEYFFSKTHIAP